MENIVSNCELVVECQEVDYQGNYKISSLLSKLSDLSTLNAIKIGIWKPELKDKYGFILAKETIVLKRPIRMYEKIKLNTRAAACKRIQFIRNYWIEDDCGSEIAAIYSVWTLLDLEKRKLTKPDKAGLVFPEIKPYQYTLEEYHEIKKDLDLEYVMDRTVLYSDVDVNQHMNNSRYVEWAMDSIALSVFKDKYFKEISLAYKKEMAPGTTAKIYRYIDDSYVKIVFKSVDEQTIYFEMGGYLERL